MLEKNEKLIMKVINFFFEKNLKVSILGPKMALFGKFLAQKKLFRKVGLFHFSCFVKFIFSQFC